MRPRAGCLSGLIAIVACLVSSSAKADPCAPGSSRCVAEDGAAVRWDTTTNWLGPAWRFPFALHQTTLAKNVTLCRPYGKSCLPVSSMQSSSFDGDHVDAATIGVAADMFAVGPLRLGIEMQFGPASGPSTRVGVAPSVHDGWFWSGGNIDIGLRFRGEHWAGYVEAVPGFVTLTADVHGSPYGDDIIASAGGYVLGGRVGVSGLPKKWLSIGLFAGAAAGEVRDLSAGLRLELRMDGIFSER